MKQIWHQTSDQCELDSKAYFFYLIVIRKQKIKIEIWFFVEVLIVTNELKSQFVIQRKTPSIQTTKYLFLKRTQKYQVAKYTY